MKHVYAVLVLALVLVFALGSAVSAGILPGENFDQPAGDPFDDGGLDEDHPWGGDRVIGGGGSETDTRAGRTSITTGYLCVDLLLTRLITYFENDLQSLSTSQTGSTSREYEKTYRTSRPGYLIRTDSRLYDGKVALR